MKYVKMNCISTLFLLTIFNILSFLLYPCPVIGAGIPREIKLLLYDAFKDSSNQGKVDYRIVNIYSGLQNTEPSLEAAIKFYITSGINNVNSEDTNGIATLKKVLLINMNEPKIKGLQAGIGIPEKDVDGIWGNNTWLALFKYIENHHGKFMDLDSKRFLVINARQLNISTKLKPVRVKEADKNKLPFKDINNALPGYLKKIVQSKPAPPKIIRANPNNGIQNINIAVTALAAKLNTLSESITRLQSQINNQPQTKDGGFAQDLLEKTDGIKSEIESLKGKISGFSQNGSPTSFLNVRSFLGVIILGAILLFIILQVFFAFRKHRSESKNNLSRYRNDIINMVSDLLNQRIPSNINSVLRELETKFKNLQYFLNSVGDTSTINQKIESLLEIQKNMIDALNRDINRLDKKTEQLRQTLVIGEKEDPAVMTLLVRMGEIRESVLSLQEKVSHTNAFSPQGKSDRTVSVSAKAKDRQINNSLAKEKEKKAPMKIQFNPDEL